MIKMIPSVIVPITGKEIFSAIGFLNTKTRISEFENKFSEYIGCNHAISTYSGTSALYILLKAFGLKRGEEIIMPAYTCESVPRLVLDMGYMIKFVDIDKETYNVSIEDLQSKITRKTKAIISIHMFGNPCEMNEIIEIAGDYNAAVIEDAAQSIGAEYHGKKIGTLGDAGFFSLGEGKPLTTINGGMIVTKNEEHAKLSREISETFNKTNTKKKVAIISKLFAYYMLNNPYFYGLIHKVIQFRRSRRRGNLLECTNLNNYKYKYTDMQASIGMIQLSNLGKYNEARIKNAEFLVKYLKEFEGIHVPRAGEHGKPIFLRLPIWFEDITEKQRENLIEKLRKSGIDAPIAYPNSLPKFFFNLNGYPNTEEVVKKTITLPTHPLVKKSDLTKIIEVIGEEWK